MQPQYLNQPPQLGRQQCMTALLSVAHIAHNALTEFCMLGAMPGTKGLNLSGRWEKVPVCAALLAALRARLEACRRRALSLC